MLSPGPISGSATSPRLQAGLSRRVLIFALALVVLSAATILGALGFEHIGGYLPCPLCLLQRTPYYLGVPVAVLAVLAVLFTAPRQVVVGLFVMFAGLMLYGGGLAVYHSGVEWGFWAGPASCAPSVGVTSAADMLNQLETTHAPSCTDAALRILGLSFAGWNVLVSALLVGLAIIAARAAWRAN